MTPEADIVTVALTRYADACPPDLHPDCPFAVAGESGRVCKSECRDEVIRLSHPGHSRISAFSGLLFDARQHLLSETGVVPHEGWHTVSLLSRLKSAIRSRPRDKTGMPWIRREIDITNALAYLGHRGFDPEWLVRFGFAESLPVLIDIWVGDSFVHHDGESEDPTGGWFAVAQRFMGPGNDYPGVGDWLAKSHQSGFTEHLRRWLAQAPIADVWAWSPTEVDEDEEMSIIDDGVPRWLVDRFTKTYIDEWAEPSLHHEFRFLRGELRAPIARSEMHKRSVPLPDVTSAIATKAVAIGTGHAHAVIPQAVNLLGEGRRKEAAALFDAARIIDPNDADAHNNYAFCITPDDPAEALRVLRRAEALETRPAPVNRVNQAVALRLLGNPIEALATAERGFAETGHVNRGGWLWRTPEDPKTCEVESVDIVTYLLNLGHDLAVELGDQTQVALWRERIAEDSG